MTYNVIFKEEATYDISEARGWYESKRYGLGDEFLDEIEEYVKTLQENPEIYQLSKSSWRYCPLKRFPYLIVFEIDETKVVEYAVFNSYKNPMRLHMWQNK